MQRFERTTPVTIQVRSQPQHPFGIAVHDLLHHFIFVAEFVPLFKNALIGQAGVIAAKHDFVLQAAANINFQIAGEVFGRPA